MRTPRRLEVLVMVIALGGCVSAEPGRTLPSNDLQQLRAEVAALNQRQQSETQELSSRLGTLTTELAGLARETEGLAARVDQALAANADRTNAVSGELQAVRERLTAMAGQLQELTRRLAATPAIEQRPLPAPAAVEQRPLSAPSVVEQPPPSAPAAPPAPAEPAMTPPTAPGRPGGPQLEPGAAATVDPQGLYNAGYTDFGRGNYALAIGAFREFIRRHPSDDMADNAQYWIAEAYLGLAHRYANAAETERAEAAFGQAIEAFQAVGQRYPQGDKVPTALFREASIYFELGQTDRARARLEYLVAHFPAAPEARLARQRLADGASP